MTRRVYANGSGVSRPGGGVHTEYSAPIVVSRTLNSDYYKNRVEESKSQREAYKMSTVKKHLGYKTPEVFQLACYALWFIDKEFTHAEAARAVGLEADFVTRVSQGGACREASIVEPPEEMIVAALSME